MKKLLLPLFFLAVMLLFGCGKTNDTNLPDDSAAPDAAVTDTTEAASEDNEPAAPVAAGQLDFTTVDFDGNTFTTADLADAKVVLLNFWEPWCGPCVGEMPELEKLYEDYQERGFLILGVYSPEMEDEVDKVLADCETSYPILHYVEAFDAFQTGYVPTTIFVTGEGDVIGETVIGSQRYKDWESLILSFELLDEEPVALIAGEDEAGKP